MPDQLHKILAVQAAKILPTKLKAIIASANKDGSPETVSRRLREIANELEKWDEKNWFDVKIEHIVDEYRQAARFVEQFGLPQGEK